MSHPAPLATVDLITAALDAIVGALEDAGVPATRDPGDFQPPGAIVQPPTITGAATMQSIGMTVPIMVVSDLPGREGVDWALGIVAVLLPVFRESAAEPTPWVGPLNPAGLPAYLITIRMNVSSA